MRKSKKSIASSNKGKSSKVRIIAGEWRSRQLPIPEIEGLRPTPDRVRETLFNWLFDRISGACCADLFCGSGALGLEALSRGAKHVTFVDSSHAVVQQMKSNLGVLNAKNADVILKNAVSFLQETPAKPMDVIFLDPPFRKGWLEKIIPLLESGWLTPNALIYIEMEKDSPLPEYPIHWQLYKEKQAGQLIYRLFRADSV